MPPAHIPLRTCLTELGDTYRAKVVRMLGDRKVAALFLAGPIADQRVQWPAAHKSLSTRDALYFQTAIPLTLLLGV